MDYGKWVVRKQVVDQQKTNDFEIIDHPSKLTHRGSRPGPGLEDGLGWTGVIGKGTTQ